MEVLNSMLFLLCSLLSVTHSSSAGAGSHRSQGLPYVVEKGETAYCDKSDVSNWASEFHECFIERKYADGGQNLNSIVDRILEHAEACVEVSSQHCRPDFPGFKTLLDKVFSQIKDYAQMYLEEIHKGREDIKDLDCVETVLSLNTYEKCFESVVSEHSLPEENLQKSIEEGISCANKENSGCSKEAKTSFNRIVRIIVGVEQPFEEQIEEVVPTEAPPPYEWYDYIIQPFISAWRAIVNFFG